MHKLEAGTSVSHDVKIKVIYRTGWALICLLVAIPLIRWIQINGFSEFTRNGMQTFLGSIGKLSGVASMVLYALGFVLSTRAKFLDTLFGGLNKAYIAHHIVGGLALITMLLHPIMLSIRYVPGRLQRAVDTFIPSYEAPIDWALNAGFAGVIITTVLLILTFYIKMPYEKWYKTHQFIGLGYLFSGLHVIFISDAFDDPFFKNYMLAILILGLAAYAYRTLFGKILVRRKGMFVTSVEMLNENIVRISMRSGDMMSPLSYEPGQFVFVRFRQYGIKRDFHPFTISSKAGTNEVTIIVKALGDYSASLQKLKIGTPADIEGAFGKFSKQASSERDQVWIAGGIGITPFLGMAKSLPENMQVELFFVIDKISDLVEYNELLMLAIRSNRRLNVMIYPTKLQSGFINGKYIAEHATGGIMDKEILICGPPMMMKSLREQFVGIGVSKKRIHSEEFALL